MRARTSFVELAMKQKKQNPNNGGTVGANGRGLPEFLRLPKSGSLCPVSGLARSAINSLILGSKPAVRSICLRRPGAARGIRLIPTKDLLAYLYSQCDAQNGKGGAK